MADRPLIVHQPVIVAEDLSENVTSSVTILNKISMVTYQFRWDGSSPSGALTIQVSNDYSLAPNGDVINAGTWTTHSFTNAAGSVASSVTVSGDTGTSFVEVTTGAWAVRAVYTASSGTGTLDAVLNCKVM